MNYFGEKSAKIGWSMRCLPVLLGDDTCLEMQIIVVFRRNVLRLPAFCHTAAAPQSRIVRAVLTGSLDLLKNQGLSWNLVA
ncbi:hypothetical protein [Xanthomonas oryzae]|uniref:hypothetical protein n=1 Tax=Xanthomonas oryzae TaxID=347 RepID=UPI0001694BB7|nr:hypothetical protein [Xanthomonas oryzae]AKN91860.1 hypothetical protein ACU13_01050 [Xanthomonas oryzae pv. oryzicola]AKN95602.1 hypothetical protein ACU10_01050 [Xanthomonas oryzae pv. oryzicola]AKO10829.1 hypothetical protein ACU14_01045 [Xanthomonas oryzae pv. oryzicola]AKO14559.1 hypothetical protein ACU12_01045 [Xanthomonas oryzae pv. oryzicola]AKO21484.1 hypothetical protein ACU11_20640 [Xanthomonas oryzae pv. oryzicola]